MERWDIYDIHRRPTGGSWERGRRVPKGIYHLVVHVCIFNKKGQMLIQQRQPFKPMFSGLWDVSCGGSVLSGETSQQGAMRELQEELGITLDLNGVRPMFTINFEGGFNDVYLVERDVDLAELKLQYEEVADARWADLDTIYEMMDAGQFVPYRRSLLALMFESRNGKYGAHGIL